MQADTDYFNGQIRKLKNSRVEMKMSSASTNYIVNISSEI